MEFHGFRSISEYERECAKHGYATCRVPCVRDGSDKKFFVLITGNPVATPSSVRTWHLFAADETEELLDGVISSLDMIKQMKKSGNFNGVDPNFIGMLDKHGYHLTA